MRIPQILMNFSAKLSNYYVLLTMYYLLCITYYVLLIMYYLLCSVYQLLIFITFTESSSVITADGLVHTKLIVHSRM